MKLDELIYEAEESSKRFAKQQILKLQQALLETYDVKPSKIELIAYDAGAICYRFKFSPGLKTEHRDAVSGYNQIRVFISDDPNDRFITISDESSAGWSTDDKVDDAISSLRSPHLLEHNKDILI